MWGWALEPVGLDDSHNVVLPNNYDPQHGPPVLMLLPGEATKEAEIKFRGTRADARFAKEIIRRSGVSVNVKPRHMRYSHSINSSYSAWVHSHALAVTPGKSAEEYDMYIPQIVIVGDEIPDGELYLGYVMVHEADHWDFFINEAPSLQSAPNGPYSNSELFSISEKRAYRTSYRSELDMGSYRGLASIAALATRYAHIRPENSNVMYDDLTKRREAAGITRRITAPLAALAIEHLFGSPDQLITNDEIVALRAAELVGA